MKAKKTSATPTALKDKKAKPPIKVPPHKKAEKSKATISEVKKIVPNTGLEMFQLLRECGLLLTTYAKQDYTLDRKKRASLLGFSLVGVSEQVRKQNLINAKKAKV